MCKCLEENCNKEAKKRGYCEKHYREKLKNGELKRFEKNPKFCEICGKCNETRRFDDKFYCPKHYMQMKRHGKIIDGTDNHSLYDKHDGFRICRECGLEKPLEDFGKQERMIYGHDYICKKCKYIYDSNKNKCTCLNCGNEFYAKRKNQHFCNKKCFGEFHRILSDEERIRNRDYPEYIKWRKSVYEKDNYTCVCCQKYASGKLNAHHLNSYDWCVEGRTNINNGITLCEECHKKFHKLFGYGNNTKEQYEKFLSLIHGNTEES